MSSNWNKEYHEKHKVYTLYGDLLNHGQLLEAWAKVKRNRGAGGVDEVSIQMFESQLSVQLEILLRQLQRKTYRPQPVRRVGIKKANSDKIRNLGIPAVRDRVVQQALKDLLEPIFDPHFSEHSHGYRQGHSAHDALNEVKLLRESYDWVIDADIKGFFDHVDHDILLDLVNERVSDGSILRLIRRFLESGVKFDGIVHASDKGTPQGGVISPLLANIYLNHLDRRLKEYGLPFVRYADDFLVFCTTRYEAESTLELISSILSNDLKLELSADKTKLVYLKYEPDSTGTIPREYGPFTFLGFVVRRRWISPTAAALNRFKDKIRSLTKRHVRYDTEQWMRGLNAVIQGWGRYFRVGTVKTLFADLDKWIRMRVRLVLGRRRIHLRHNPRWQKELQLIYPNSVLGEMGLTTLVNLLT